MRLFLMGDSFTENLFKFWYKNIKMANNNAEAQELVNNNEIAQYLIYLEKHGYEKAKYLDDVLSDMGYEIYNFGKGGCTIEDIIYQFSNLSKFESRDGDRIILNWTHPSRFNWINDNNKINFIHSNYNHIQPNDNNTDLAYATKLIRQQTINRENSFFDKSHGYLNKKLLVFMEYLIEIHSKYKPIVWTPFPDVDEIILNQRWTFSFINKTVYKDFLFKLPNNLSIIHETNGLFKDHHFGRYGNYYIAILLDEIIKNNLGPNYMDHKYIFDAALNRIKLEDKKFKMI